MDLDEIEEVYRKECEDAENDFLKSVANKKDSSSAEKTYTGRIKSAREKYERLVRSYLENEKKNRGKKGQKPVLERNEQFKVIPGEFELSHWEKRKLKWHLFFFKTHFNLRNELRQKTPGFLSYYFYLWKLLFKRFFGAIRDFFAQMISEIVSSLQHTLEALGELSKKIFKYLSELPGKILSLFKKKSKAVGGEAKPEVKEETKEESS